jgi:hypothetical protein
MTGRGFLRNYNITDAKVREKESTAGEAFYVTITFPVLDYNTTKQEVLKRGQHDKGELST